MRPTRAIRDKVVNKTRKRANDDSYWKFVENKWMINYDVWDTVQARVGIPIGVLVMQVREDVRDGCQKCHGPGQV